MYKLLTVLSLLKELESQKISSVEFVKAVQVIGIKNPLSFVGALIKESFIIKGSNGYQLTLKGVEKLHQLKNAYESIDEDLKEISKKFA